MVVTISMRIIEEKKELTYEEENGPGVVRIEEDKAEEWKKLNATCTLQIQLLFAQILLSSSFLIQSVGFVCVAVCVCVFEECGKIDGE